MNVLNTKVIFDFGLLCVFKHSLGVVKLGLQSVSHQLVPLSLPHSAGIVGVPVAVKCLSLKLKLKSVDMSVLHIAGQCILLCGLLLGLEWMLGTDHGCEQLIIPATFSLEIGRFCVNLLTWDYI